MKVTLCRPGHPARSIPGPGDLPTAQPGDVLVLQAAASPSDHGSWAPMLGSAVLRGVEVRWTDG